MRHRSVAELERAMDHLRAAPADHGVLELVVCRPDLAQRRILDAGALDAQVGLVGDTWADRPSTSSPDGRAHPDKQVTVMSHRMVALLGDSPEEWALAGDQLYVDLDLSVENLPPGTRLAIGSAVIEVTEPPHRGCAKFVRRFGEDAMRFVNGREGRALRLRGLNARVVVPGTIRPGDKVVPDRRSSRAEVSVAARFLDTTALNDGGWGQAESETVPPALPASSRATGTRNGEQDT